MTCKICKWANHPPCPKNIPCCDCNEECNSRQCVEEEPKTETKVCRTCGQELPLTEYYPQPGGVMGCKAECKRCYIERKLQLRSKNPYHKVKHRTTMHEVVKAEQPAEPKPRKKRVANGKGDRSEYMKKYYQGQKERLTEKNHADYIRRKPLKVGRTCLQCVNYPCFAGIENLESDFANEGCHAFRKREEEK